MTCAHELGHHFLIDDAEDVEVIEDQSRMMTKTDPVERAAFLFASELLMPELGVRSLIAEYDDAEDSVGAVSRTFAVSPHAAAVRLSELGIIDATTTAAIVREIQENWRDFWKRQHIPAESRARQNEASLPSDFVERAGRLHDAGILADDRFEELVDRELPTAQ
jgi:Zn-dependent peptidase ImmA (M78 family)